MIYTSEMIWNELQDIKKELRKLKQLKVVEHTRELSLSRVSRDILHIGPEEIIRLVKRGKLKARTYKDKHNKTRYKFRAVDIAEFQKNGKYNHISFNSHRLETSEQLADRLAEKYLRN